MIVFFFRLFLGTMPESCTCTGVVTSKLLVKKGFIQSWSIYILALSIVASLVDLLSFVIIFFNFERLYQRRCFLHPLTVNKFAGIIHFFSFHIEVSAGGGTGCSDDLLQAGAVSALI